MIGLVSGLAAACSSDTMRFASDPFSNPFGSSRGEPTMTGSLGPVAAAPSGAVEMAPLAPPLAGPQPIVAASPLPASTPTRADGPAGWTPLGGTPIVVRQGETLTSLADRYNVPASAILSANGFTRAAQVTPGTTIVIPVFNAVGSQTASSAPVTAPAPVPLPAARQPAPIQTAVSPSAPAVAPPRRPQQLAAPQRAPAATAAATQVQPPRAPQSAPAPVAAPQQNAASQPAPAAREPTATGSLPSDAGGLDFRWPARGRVIAGFGTGGNEGINIAVPEGTPVRAAESGTVAYAGSELKGYGNLVLIRHENGFVSAYAHNSELLVKRGDTVRRGQVIANSGRTGNVNAPQLHFEIRKGSDPVDPMPYLRN